MNFVNFLAKQLGPKGIRVNGVAPGPIWTALQVSGGATQEHLIHFGELFRYVELVNRRSLQVFMFSWRRAIPVTPHGVAAGPASPDVVIECSTCAHGQCVSPMNSAYLAKITTFACGSPFRPSRARNQAQSRQPLSDSDYL